MGTNSAVTLAELSLGYLEEIIGFNPNEYRRYIDDALVKIPRKHARMETHKILLKMNGLDTNIKWLSEFDFSKPETIFLDLKIQYSPLKIQQYHKPSKSWISYVPYNSKHPQHTLLNLPRSLYNRAMTLNKDTDTQKLAFTRLDAGLLALNYPKSLLDSSKTEKKAKQSFIPLNSLVERKNVYFVITNNQLNTNNKLHNDVKAINNILHKDPTGGTSNINIQISRRQPPSIKSQNNMITSANQNTHPTKCGRTCCDLCPLISTDKVFEIVDYNGVEHKLQAARFSCKSSNLVYFIFDTKNKRALYCGHTGQALETRFRQHRGGKKKNSGKSRIRYGFLPETSKNFIDFRISAIQASKYRVRRLNLEYHWIQTLLPLWNCQLVHQWWMSKSYETKTHEIEEMCD